MFISAEDAGDFIRTVSELYRALLMNWFYLPRQKSSCITSIYLGKVMRLEHWVPKHNEVKLRPCLCPPAKELLFTYLQSEASLQAISLGFDKQHMPDKEWMLVALATINEHHLVFAKNYKPDPAPLKKAVMSQVMIPNTNGFFTGLPKSNKKGSVFKQLCSVEQINRAKRQKLEAHQVHVQEQLQQLSLNKDHRVPLFKGRVDMVLDDEDTSVDLRSDHFHQDS